ncbi:MAG TPA: hypothetical protein VKU19_33390 [Bryobacteraceae bacterium]|nr:hypothetical protein [Bryobacteraceae bacterium]
MTKLKTASWRSLAHPSFRAGIVSRIVESLIVLAVAGHCQAQGVGASYPKMAALDQYLMTQDAEVALARSAAPESISKDAEILVLNQHGYGTVIKGRNGFVCAVQRSWTASLDDPGFWNPKLRAPTCFNASAARSFLPRVIRRTELVLAGKSKEQLSSEMKAAFEAKQIPAIEPGSIAYMLSKQGYLGDQAGHWHPHIMVFAPEGELAGWGANMPSSPVFGGSDHTDRVTTLFIPVLQWSDGSADSSSH